MVGVPLLLLLSASHRKGHRFHNMAFQISSISLHDVRNATRDFHPLSSRLYSLSSHGNSVVSHHWQHGLFYPGLCTVPSTTCLYPDEACFTEVVGLSAGQSSRQSGMDCTELYWRFRDWFSSTGRDMGDLSACAEICARTKKAIGRAPSSCINSSLSTTTSNNARLRTRRLQLGPCWISTVWSMQSMGLAEISAWWWHVQTPSNW